MSTKEHWYPGRLKELDQAECLELMRTRSVGRVAYCDDDGPVVLPVNYVVADDGGVLFRTSPHTPLAQHLASGPAAFEVDEIDDVTESGWSVLVRGTASYVDPDDLPADDDDRPSPWAAGVRTLHVRVSPRVVSGRRLIPS